MLNVSEYVSQNPEIMGGRVCFKGTRVPIEILFENLSAGLTLDEILESYPTIPAKAALAVLEESMKEIIETTRKLKI